MAANFTKNSSFDEEFKELHFLNTEVNLNSNVNWKNNVNTPLQEYIQKINKREQETEKTYKDLMRHMEDLGKRTDQMTLKLEKLNALRNVALSSNISALSSTEATYDRPFQSYYSNSLLQTTPKMLSTDVPVSDFHPRIQPDVSFISHSFQHSSSKPNYHSVTTQTEYIFCDNCHFPLILSSEMPVPNLNLPARTCDKTVTKENEQNVSHNPARTWENVEFPRETIVTKSVVENNNLVPKSNNNFSDPQVNDHDDSMLMNERMSSGIAEISLKEQELMNEQVGKRMSKSYFDNAVTGDFTNEPVQKRMSESFTDNAVADGLANELVQKRMSKSFTDNAVADGVANELVQKRMPKSYTDNAFTDEPTNVSVQKRMSETYIDNAVTGDYITHTEEKQYIEIQDNDLVSNDGNFEQTISKSDDESMSREFNFLDSDKSKIPKRQPLHQMSGDSNSQLTEGVKHHENTQLEASYATQSNPNTHLLKVQQTSGSGEKIGVSTKDLSYSVGPPSPSAHSENTSIVSESDSFSEKETPLTATAAYQALLGNVSVAKPKQRSAPISDSDSEDEIENALANAVRRTSHIAFDAAILDPKAEKRKESIAEIKAERNTKYFALLILIFKSILCSYLENTIDQVVG
ncbi:hypothetical protein AVEN_77245-1 [Araneus ventricosus]|uniref:Uncharacterized protein n=1 Tax=Araneus ventricosus TaxID=182803 RepID=A0A4Y2Q8E9_ARAVE|nr:hypothetical protein AVEN_77245-1 [Araneus ventricosus]